MATANGQSAANGEGGLSLAQKLMQKHDEGHQPAVEEVIDEDDLKHGEEPKSSAVLESTEDAPVPTWAPTMSSKSAGKQKAQDPVAKETSKPLDTQSHELFPELGGAPKSQAAPTVPLWGAKKPGNSPAPVNGKSNGLPPSTASSKGSAPASGNATPTSTATPATSRAPGGLSIPGRHTERITLESAEILPRKDMKKPLADILKEINKKSKANVAMQPGLGGKTQFTATGPVDATRQALSDLVKQIGSKASKRYHVLIQNTDYPPAICYRPNSSFHSCSHHWKTRLYYKVNPRKDWCPNSNAQDG